MIRTGLYDNGLGVVIENDVKKEEYHVNLWENHPECNGCDDDCDYCAAKFDEEKKSFSVREEIIATESRREKFFKTYDYTNFIEAFEDFTEKVKKCYKEIHKEDCFDGRMQNDP